MLVVGVRRAALSSTRSASWRLYSTQQNTTVETLQGLMQSLGPSETVSDTSTPPLGTAFPAAQGPPSSMSSSPLKKPSPNPLDKNVLLNYQENKLRYRLYCQSTRNNTITTLMDGDFKHVASFSGGSCGFKKVNRSGYEAGYQCAVRIFKIIEAEAKEKPFEIDLYFKGFGQGRDAMHKALLTSEGEMVRPLLASITDRTPIKIGGTRAKKARRL
ncbi:hypothetical protein H0H93_007703 [Arthromyces matolae]|nr:hypothetical protein H0H93_007703 [Arthromyces matolae]